MRDINKETLKTQITAAVKYYSEAEEFEKWLESKGLLELKTSDAVYENGKEKDENNKTLCENEEWRRL